MADIRIKDLTTTASSTASDDFIAVDGTTNGTRKLSAFSPTFGGNATVTGTLTVNGAGGSIGGQWKITNATIPDVWLQNTSGATSAYRNILIRQNSDDTFKFLSTSDAGVLSKDNILTGSNANGAIGIGVTPAAGASSLTVAGVIKTNDTTASTTTSTGALVVGNGTSGGLGVGGAIVAGGTITSTASTDSGLLQLNLVNSSTGTSASSLFRFNAGTRTATLQAYNDTHATLAGQLRIGTSNGDIVLIPSGVAAATFGASSISLGALSSATTIIGGDTGSGTNILLLKDGLGTLKVNFKGNGDIAVLSSTASTSTSSGALVVSGGVGVAGSQYLGAKLNISTHTGDAGGIGFGTETNLYRYQAGGLALDHASGAAPALLFRETGTSTLRLETNSGVGYLSTLTSANLILRTNSQTALTLDTSQNAVFAGTIRTAAPSGGTAASWKLGTVATVSPTSPNRTIEVDIGGTIYYIHAKTTNN